MTTLPVELPNVSELTNYSFNDQPTPYSTQSDEEKEALRTSYIKACRDYTEKFIQRTSVEQIISRANDPDQSNSCDVFVFSPPNKRGYRTRFYSQVVYDTETQTCHFEYFRPVRHPRHLWYWPVYYVMNGYTKNPQRTFEALGLVPVEVSLDQWFTSKGYRVEFHRSQLVDGQPTGNITRVEWD